MACAAARHNYTFLALLMATYLSPRPKPGQPRGHSEPRPRAKKTGRSCSMGASSAQCTMGASRAHSPPFGTPLLSCDTYFLTRWTTHNYSILTETHPAWTMVMYGGQCGLSVAGRISLHPLATSLITLPCLSSQPHVSLSTTWPHVSLNALHCAQCVAPYIALAGLHLF